MRGIKIFGIRLILERDFWTEKSEAWEDGFEACRIRRARDIAATKKLVNNNILKDRKQ